MGVFLAGKRLPEEKSSGALVANANRDFWRREEFTVGEKAMCVLPSIRSRMQGFGAMKGDSNSGLSNQA